MRQSRDSFAKIWPELEGFPQISSAFLRYGLSEEQPQVLRPPFAFDKLKVWSLRMTAARVGHPAWFCHPDAKRPTGDRGPLWFEVSNRSTSAWALPWTRDALLELDALPVLDALLEPDAVGARDALPVLVPGAPLELDALPARDETLGPDALLELDALLGRDALLRRDALLELDALPVPVPVPGAVGARDALPARDETLGPDAPLEQDAMLEPDAIGALPQRELPGQDGTQASVQPSAWPLSSPQRARRAFHRPEAFGQPGSWGGRHWPWQRRSCRSWPRSGAAFGWR
jgi:hypothetical protein